ncbi:hypothetical protein ABL78_1816 [Leptomonas seymouri]|uniref:Uncharacterized protein n=1 Tax=Leptomonas seymouri TaxID=5684 RepID=A0A0N1PES0_LEPSE|nr:hypothetical protein ABL78_1816 [Leptomonas seymouri]|eukprot:KPI89080.1 hypothetical protein ABL78_1816 [Leptomonas seymouri]
MRTPTSDVLDCCEEAFRFDLARGDMWRYAMEDDGTSTTATTAAASPPPPPHFCFYESAQHRCVAAVEWSTLQVLLRHATRSCAGLSSSREVNNYIVEALLDEKPLTASAAAAARERIVGKLLPLRDLALVLSRAGPLQASALANVKSVFEILLAIEGAMVGLAKEELSARHALVSSERSAWKDVTSAVRRAQQLWRYERVLQQQQMTQQLVVDAHRNTRLTVPNPSYSSMEVKSVVASAQAKESAAEDEVCFRHLNGVVGGQLCQSQTEMHLVTNALQAVATALRSPSWCLESMQRAVAAYAGRLDARIASVEEKMAGARASVGRLCRARAGRRLMSQLGSELSQPKAPSFSKRVASDTSASSSPSETSDEIQMGTKSVKATHEMSAEALSIEEIARGLYISVAGLRSELEGNGARMGTEVAEEVADTAATGRYLTPPDIDFPSFDYFAEFCDFYPSWTDMDARWSLFARYAACATGTRGGAAQRATLSTPPWCRPHRMHYRGFYQFLKGLMRCADGSAGVPLDEMRFKIFLTEVLLPRWEGRHQCS